VPRAEPAVEPAPRHLGGDEHEHDAGAQLRELRELRHDRDVRQHEPLDER
jgi:hypothetical protein